MDTVSVSDANKPPNDLTKITISFCVSCRNRLWQLKETLAANLSELNAQHNIVLVDFGSPEPLSSWIWSNFEAEIKNKKLIFFEVLNEVVWSSPKAKNLAHRVATGNYLFNLDADNFISERDIRIIEKAAARGLACQQFSGVWPDGSFGRIGMPRNTFMKLGGYDESMLPMGGQDMDLVKRVIKLDGKIAKLPSPLMKAIQNTDDHKMAGVVSVAQNAKDSWKIMNEFNLNMSNIKMQVEGPCRLGGYSSFKGKLNGNLVVIDGFNTIRKISQN